VTGKSRENGRRWLRHGRWARGPDDFLREGPEREVQEAAERQTHGTTGDDVQRQMRTDETRPARTSDTATHSAMRQDRARRYGWSRTATATAMAILDGLPHLELRAPGDQERRCETEPPQDRRGECAERDHQEVADLHEGPDGIGEEAGEAVERAEGCLFEVARSITVDR
jgi:hypothetical protein